MKAVLFVVVAVLLQACSSSVPGPAQVDTRNDMCAHCRMPVSDARLAGQIVAPGEEPRFFDDLGCLRDYLAAHADLPAQSRVFVADYANGGWLPAGSAVYRRVAEIETPMGSHMIAFATADASNAVPSDAPRLSASDVFGAGSVAASSR